MAGAACVDCQVAVVCTDADVAVYSLSVLYTTMQTHARNLGLCRLSLVVIQLSLLRGPCCCCCCCCAGDTAVPVRHAHGIRVAGVRAGIGLMQLLLLGCLLSRDLRPRPLPHGLQHRAGGVVDDDDLLALAVGLIRVLGRPSLAVGASPCGGLCLFARRHGIGLWGRVRVPEREGRRDAERGGCAIGVRGGRRRGKVGRAVVVRREGGIGGVVVARPQMGRVGVGVGGRRMPRGGAEGVDGGQREELRPEMLGGGGGEVREGEGEGERAAVRAHGRRG